MTSQTAPRYVFGLIEERFENEDFATREEAIAAGRQEAYEEDDYEPGMMTTVWTGIKHPVRFSQLLPWWHNVQDTMQERAFELAGEVTEDWLPHDLSDEAKADCRRVLDEWATRHGLQPSWFSVDSIEEHRVMVGPAASAPE